MCTWGKVAVHPAEEDGSAVNAESPAALFAAMVERCELDHDQVLMVCGSGRRQSAWDEFCLARADRLLAVVDASASSAANGNAAEGQGETWAAALRGADLLAYGVRPGEELLVRWLDLLEPASVFAVGDGARRDEGIMRGAEAERARGWACAQRRGLRVRPPRGARGAPGAGMEVDRVGGVSMGAFIGGLLAAGHDSAAIDACCYEEWVRRNPINDYTIPRAGLIRGRKAQMMLERIFGEARLEELSRSFYCVSRFHAAHDGRHRAVLEDPGRPRPGAVVGSQAAPSCRSPSRRHACSEPALAVAVERVEGGGSLASPSVRSS